jgi:uncharacterized protein
MEWIVLFFVGLCAGTLGSIVGLGGGIITVPALIYGDKIIPFMQSVSPQTAVGTSLFVMIFTGLASTLSYMKQRTVDYKSGWIFLIGSAPGGIVGAWITKFLGLKSFSIYFGVLIIGVSLLLMLKNRVRPLNRGKKTGMVRTYVNEKGESMTYAFHPFLGIAVAFVVGLFSGMFGIGGGSLMVPAMILLFAFPPHVAVATSMFMIFISSIISSSAHVTLGHVSWAFAVFLIPGAWFGGKLGSKISAKLKGDTVVFLLRMILIVIGIRLIYQGLL